jgi:uronate dehydrogenase
MTTTVLITGGSGGIATRVRPFLHELGWTVRLLDTRPPEPAASTNEEVLLGSIHDPELLARAMDGVGLVVHLAAHASERPWDVILADNVDATRTVLHAAAEAGVRRFLFASSIHAVGFTPTAELRDAPVMPPRPDTYYGASKAIGEALGVLYADRYGMSVVSARIVNASMYLEHAGARIMWFSPADSARLMAATAALEQPGHHIVWGVSRGGEQWLPLDAGRAMGYDPQDDARVAGDHDLPAQGLAGGDFTEAPLGADWRPGG